MKTAWLIGPHKIEIKETEGFSGELKDHDVLIKMKATTICASDTKHFKREKTYDGRAYPFMLGHEPSGIIAAVGSKVTKVKVGDRITIEPQNSCKECFNCKRGFPNMCENPKFMASKSYRGSLTEEIIWPEELVWKIPDVMPYEVAAMLEPMSIAYSAIKEMNFKVTNKVAILGAGAIGSLSRIIFHMINPEIECYLLDISEEKLNLNMNIGIENTIYINSSKEYRLPKIDAIIDTTGIGSLINSLYKYLNCGGYIGCIGFTDTPNPIVLPPRDILYKGTTIHGSIRFVNTFEPLLKMIGENESYINSLSKIITYSFPLEETDAAFRKAAFETDYLKIVVTANRD